MEHTLIAVDLAKNVFEILKLNHYHEGRAVLKDAGANRVIPIAVGFHPDNIGAGPGVTYPPCPTCGHPTRIRCRTKDGGLFLGCGDLDVLRRGERHGVIRFGEFYEGAVVQS